MNTRCPIRIKIMHVVGSPTDEYNFRLNLLYASACIPGDVFDFCFAVIFPDGRWCFPSSLENGALEAAEKMNIDVAIRTMMAWRPNAVHSHLFCVKGQTDYRGLLFSLGFPMIGSSPTSYGQCKDKGLTRGALSGYNLQADGLIIKRWNQQCQVETWKREGSFPCIVKAADLDDSLGLSRVDQEADLEQAVEMCFQAGAGSVVIEKFIPGAELRIGVIESSDGELRLLPVIDYLMEDDQIRSLQYKLNLDSNGIPTGKSAKNKSRIFDPNEDNKLKEKLEKVTFTAFRLLDLHDFALFDIRVDGEGEPWLLEANLFCSFGDQSVLCQMAKQEGISATQLLAMMAQNAILRNYGDCEETNAQRSCGV